MIGFQGEAGGPSEPNWSALFPNDVDVVAAHDHWSSIVQELQAVGTMASVNRDAIRRLVEFRIQYDRAAKHVAINGAILAPRNKKTLTGQWNPFWSVMRQADASIMKLEAELGISPVRRGKVTKVARGKKVSRAADAYLKPVSR